MTLPLELGGIDNDQTRRALENIAQQFPIGPVQLMARSVTTLPASPVDGMEVYYTADSTNGVIWHLRYRTASGKWEFVGGSPLYAEITTDETTASLTYVALTTAGPSIAIPVAGDYDVEIGANMYNNTTATGNFMSYDIGGTGAVDGDSAKQGQPGGGGNTATASVVRLRRKTGLTAVTLTAKYRVTGGTGDFRDRWMKVTPVRLG